MRNAQKPDHVTLNSLIRRIREGVYVIPDFQRDFEWEPWDISNLMRSIFLDYYIGSLLLWKGRPANFDALSCQPIFGFEGSSDERKYIVLDGQQRLTAIHYAFFAPDEPLPRRKGRAYYFVRVDRLMDGSHDEAFFYEWATKRVQKIMDDPEAQFQEHLFPLSVIGATDDWALFNWAQSYAQYWEKRAQETGDDKDRARVDDAKEFGALLRAVTGEYQVSYIELAEELAVDKVCDIFTQINSRGVRLDVFDLINALIRPKGLQLKHMWHAAEPRLDFVSSRKLNVYVLQTMSILRQAYCSPKYLYFLLPGQTKPVRDPGGTRRTEVLIDSPQEFADLWDRAVDALESAIQTLRQPQEYGVVSSKYLPYVSILPAFAALLEAAAKVTPNKRLEAQRKVRHWYWASIFTNRYSGSVESTMARDYIDVTAWLDDDNATPAVIQELEQRFRNLDLKREVRQGTSVYNGIFNLLVIQGARDWVSGTIPTAEDLDDHHIVPVSWGRKNRLGNQINSVLNRTPLTAESNRNLLRDRLPNEYMRDLLDNNSQDQVRMVLESHFISQRALEILLRDPFTPDDFEEFLAERQRTLLDAIENLLVKERLDLNPTLRALDAKVEDVELRLRALIAKDLGNDPGRLPDHVQVKLDQRLASALRTNATLDASAFDSLDQRLEFSDLRELQDTLCSKACWSTFEPRFGKKEALNTKFGQLANLRNGIRHSRSVDEITRKEGEAALLWFDALLTKPDQPHANP